MEEPARDTSSVIQENAGSERRRDLAALALLLLLTLGIRAWVLYSTTVPARDSIGFIRCALRLENESWSRVVTTNHQHPGYPLAILAVSLPIRHCFGTDCDTMQLSAQLASSLAGLLLVVPMFCLGKHLFDRGVGFWAALLFQCLPDSGHILSDAISDPLFLLLSTTSLLLAVRAVGGDSLGRFALSGVACGLAYLTRPEGALVLVATGTVLLGMQAVPAWRRPWRRTLACGTALAVAALATGSPYFLTTGCFTNKPSLTQLTGQEFTGRTVDEETPCCQAPCQPLLASVLAVHLDLTAPLGRRLTQGARGLGGEFVQSYQYIGWLPALLGFWWCRDRFRRLPGAWVLLTLFVLHTLLLWWLTVRAGYVSDRHILLLILCTIYQAVAVVREAPARLQTWLQRRHGGPLWLNAPAWSLALLLALTGVGLARTLQPLHGHRAGHHAAGRWLAEHAQPADVIDDDHCWAHYYAGCVFRENKKVPCPEGYTPRRYVVVSRASERRLPSHPIVVSEPALRAEGGRIVYRWPENGGDDNAKVVVYLMR